MSTLGRLVLIFWLFVVLIINSSYTASLTSILTVQQLSSRIQGIDSLVSSWEPIGIQDGSFVHRYLVDELHVAEGRLRVLRNEDEYVKALLQGPTRGGVAAIVDELPYVELFLSNTRCLFTTVGQDFTKNGWGFVSSFKTLNAHISSRDWVNNKSNPVGHSPIAIWSQQYIFSRH